MSSTDDLRSTIESTLLALLKTQAISSSNRDASRIAALLTPDCKWFIKPESFISRYPFIKSPRTVADEEEHLAREISVLDESRVNILDSVVDAAARKASARTELWTKYAGNEPSTMEICWYFDFTDDGKKVSRVVEFIDTSASSKVLEDMAKAGYKMDEEAGAAGK
ncbi:hypothetical protein F5Y05DRAFT_105097 [Hypoxylon sp. FL0543]|nr:hypothetical protein F5Y05DRAFT_105097 [Hypoxylon sp. FL0543]